MRQEQLSNDKPYFQERYDVYHGVADLFVYFFAQGLRLLKSGGKLAYISSNTWIRANYATPLRKHLPTQTKVETIVCVGNTRVFADAPDLSPSIQIVSKEIPDDTHTAKIATFVRGEQIKAFKDQLADRLFALSIFDQLDTGWQLTMPELRTLFTKIMKVGKPLGEFVAKHMYRGVLTGLNEAFIIDQIIRDELVKEGPACINIIKPMLRGEDLRPWYQENEGRWLIFTRRGIDIETYPSVKNHLQQFREQLEPRSNNKDDTTSLLGRKPGTYKWYEIQDSVDYHSEFDKPKIFWPDIARFPRFSYDNQGQFVNNKGYILLQNEKGQTDLSLLPVVC